MLDYAVAYDLLACIIIMHTVFSFVTQTGEIEHACDVTDVFSRLTFMSGAYVHVVCCFFVKLSAFFFLQFNSVVPIYSVYVVRPVLSFSFAHVCTTCFFAAGKILMSRSCSSGALVLSCDDTIFPAYQVILQ